METKTDFRKIVLDLCRRALKGNLTADQFYEAWRPEIDAMGSYSEIYDDLEEGVLHFPGKLFSRKPDYSVWLETDMYKVLYLDELLLASSLDMSKVAEIRKKILQESTYLDIQDIEQCFDRYG